MIVHKQVMDFSDARFTKKIEHSSNGKILSVAVQNNKVVVYFLNEPMADQEFHSRIHFVMTGERPEGLDLQYGLRFIGTLMLDDGAFVLHAFADV